ncbi:DUF6608 family protein [Clostridium oceanicum]|uniref:Uncharacterized protein n=1 Tax=Clostridium oceanicum TaxID=1543 RepID=A0ABP3UUE4_9CLOT
MDKNISKTILWYIPIMAIVFVLVYTSSFFIELADNAYFDIFRSVTVPYSIYVIYLICKKATLETRQQRGSSNNSKSKIIINTKTNSNSAFRKIKNCFNTDESVMFNILEIFMLLTIINNLMMVFGIDPNPKIGKFAYIHLTIRFSIISLIMIAIRGKKVIKDYKNFNHSIKKLSNYSNLKSSIFENFRINKYRCTYVLFTTITIGICIFTIFFVPTPTGGVKFYFNLLIMFCVIVIFTIVTSMIFKAKYNKK